MGEEVAVDTQKGGPFELVSYRLGALPLVNHFWDRIGLDALLARWLPGRDRRFRLDPAVAIRLVVVNLLVGRTPLYDWANGRRRSRRSCWAQPTRTTWRAQRRPDRAGAAEAVRGRPGQPAHRADRRRGRRVRCGHLRNCTTTRPRS